MVAGCHGWAAEGAANIASAQPLTPHSTSFVNPTSGHAGESGASHRRVVIRRVGVPPGELTAGGRACRKTHSAAGTACALRTVASRVGKASISTLGRTLHTMWRMTPAPNPRDAFIQVAARRAGKAAVALRPRDHPHSLDFATLYDASSHGCVTL